MYLEKNEDDSYTYPGPQLVYQEEYMGDIYDYYLVPFTLGEDEEGYAVTTPCQTVNFNMVDGKLVQEVTEDEVLLGLFEYDAEEGFLWTGYTDWNIVFEPMTSVAATLPEGVAAEKWVAVSGDSGYFTEVAIDGAKIYVKGLVYGNDEGVAVGTINGDEVTFAAGQFLGADPYGYWTYLYGGQIEEEWDDYWEEYVYVAVLEGDLVFTYDAEAKKLVNKNALIVTNNASENLEEVAVSGYIDPLTIEYQVRNPEAAPQDPYGLEFYDEMEEWGSNSFYFSIPEFDVDGNLLEPEKLFYRIYVDGEPFIFYSDEYVGLPEDEMELINCQFTNYEDIFSSGVDKGIYLYFEGADTLGVQSVYIDTVNGEEVKTESKVVTISTNDAVRGVEAEAASVATEWFDLQGRRIANPGKGIGIRIDLKADGSRKAVKVVR